MNAIGKKIKYLPAANDPLSADVYYIEAMNTVIFMMLEAMIPAYIA